MTSTRIYAPDGATGRPGTDLASLPSTLSGQRIIALDNGKPGADTLLEHLGEQLAARTGASFSGVLRKGSAATPCEEPLLDSITCSADLVITGTAD
jgi:hypothetical protein